MLTIDSDGHLREPFDLFDRYLDRAYWARRPRIVRIEDHAIDRGRWLIEGRLVPRLPFTPGVGAGSFRGPGPRHPGVMRARDDTLDDVRAGRILTGFELEEDLRYILDKLGAASLMYASDYPHGDMSWSKVADTRAHPDLTPAEVDALLGGNAARFYKLPVAAPA